MTFKKETTTWKMTHANHTAFISRWLGTFHSTYYLTIDIDTFDGQYYELKRLVNKKEFCTLNEAKKYAKEFINSNN